MAERSIIKRKKVHINPIQRILEFNRIWNQSEFDLFVQKAGNAGIHIEEFKPITLSKDESALLLEFYDKNERLILTALETMRFSTPWCNGEDIDSPDADLRDELEATLRRIRTRKNRKN